MQHISFRQYVRNRNAQRPYQSPWGGNNLLGVNLANSGGQPFNFQGLLGGYADPQMAALQRASQAASESAGYHTSPVSLGQMIGKMGSAAQQGVLGANQQNFANYGQALNMKMLRQKMQGTQAAAKTAAGERAAFGKYAAKFNLPLDMPKEFYIEHAKAQTSRGKEAREAETARKLVEHRRDLTPPFTGAERDLITGKWVAGEAYQASRLEIAAEQAEAAERVRQGGLNITPGQRDVDAAYGQEYLDWTSKGATDVEKGLAQLDSALVVIQSGRDISGAWNVIVPKFLLPLVNAEALDVQERISEVVQRNLRLILGAQFTEKESRDLIARAYNPDLSEEINAKRVGRLVKSMRAAALEKQKMALHYQEKGTLQGYKGSKITFGSISKGAGLDKKAPPQKKLPPPPAGFVVNPVIRK